VTRPQHQMIIDSQTSEVYKGRIYLFGGFIGGVKPYYSNKVFQFDITEICYKEIKTSGSIPEPRTDHASCMVGNQMAIIGGVTSQNVYLNDIFLLDLGTMIWSTIKTHGEAPSPRTGHDIAFHKDTIFLLGGHEEARKEVTKLYCLDFKTQTWRKFCDKFTEDYDKEDEYQYKRRMIQRSQSPTRSYLSKSRSPDSPKKNASPYSPHKSPGDSKLISSTVHEVERTMGSSSLEKIPAQNKITAQSLKIERLKKKKALEKKKLLGEFADIKVSRKDMADKDILRMQSVLDSITPDRPYRATEKSVENKKKRLPVMRPGISLFAEKIGSRLEPVRLPHLDSLSLTPNASQLFVFGGDKCGLCCNDLYVLDMEDLLSSQKYS
jgi:hypothetical protein